MNLTIRSKVLLLSLTLFSVPYVGYEYVREMEKYLRDNLETSLQDTARALASVLNERPNLFSRRLLDTVREDSQLVAHNIQSTIKLDGYTNDWADYLDNAGNYAEKYILKNNGDYSSDSLSFTHVLGKYRNYLYALFIVRDDKIVYRDKNSLYLDQSDHLQIVMQDPNQQFYRYLITPSELGWITAYKVANYENYVSPQTETRI